MESTSKPWCPPRCLGTTDIKIETKVTVVGLQCISIFFIKVSSSIKSSRLCMTIHVTLHFSNIKLFFGYVGSHFVRLMNNYHHLPGSWNVLKGKSSRCSCRQIMLSCCSCQAGSSETTSRPAFYLVWSFAFGLFTLTVLLLFFCCLYQAS